MAAPSQPQLNYDGVSTGVLNSHSNVFDSSVSDHPDIMTNPEQLESELVHDIPNGGLNSHSKVSNSANSDHSNMITDPVQLERELAQEVLNRDLATNKQDELLKWPTISYEEALEREQQYQKRLIKMFFLQRSAHTAAFHNPSQQQPPSQNLLGVKRKSIHGELADGSRNPSWQLPSRPPPPQQSQHRRPPRPSTFNQEPLARGCKRPLQRHSRRPQPLNSTKVVLQCNICNVSCGNFENLMTHYQGKKHKAMWEKTARRGPGGARLATSSVWQQEAPSTMNHPQ